MRDFEFIDIDSIEPFIFEGYERHKGQSEVFDAISKYKFIVIPCGRRFGKTTCIAEVDNPLIDLACLGENVAIFTPTRKDADPHYYAVTRNFDDVINWKDGTSRRIIFNSDGILEFWTLPNQGKKDSGRGRNYALVIYDETQKIPDDILRYHIVNVIYPLLLDYDDAKIVFLGTPNGKGTFFHELQKRGAYNGAKAGLLGDNYDDISPFPLNADNSNQFENWITVRRPTSANPHINKATIELMRKEFDEQTALQEIDAISINYAGAVWCYALKKVEVQRKTFKTGLRVDWNQPIYLTFDFNKQPQSCLLFQLPPLHQKAKKVPGDNYVSRWLTKIKFIKEFSTDIDEKSTIYDIIRMIQDFIFAETGKKVGKWYGGTKKGGEWNLIGNYPCSVIIYVTGDASGDDDGDGRQKAPRDYYDIIAEELNIEQRLFFKIPSKNPYHADSCIQVNTYLERHPFFEVDENQCPLLKKDMLTVKADKHRGIDKSDKTLTHKLDGLRYGLNTFDTIIEFKN